MEKYKKTAEDAKGRMAVMDAELVAARKVCVSVSSLLLSPVAGTRCERCNIHALLEAVVALQMLSAQRAHVLWVALVLVGG